MTDLQLKFGEWTHLALVLSRHRIDVYMNGQLAESKEFVYPRVGSKAVVLELGSGFHGQVAVSLFTGAL